MKAILVIDINDEKLIGKMGTSIKMLNDIYKTNWKLRPMPQKRTLPKWQTIGTPYGEEPWFTDGYNACIDEILGEENAQVNS